MGIIQCVRQLNLHLSRVAYWVAVIGLSYWQLLLCSVCVYLCHSLPWLSAVPSCCSAAQPAAIHTFKHPCFHHLLINAAVLAAVLHGLTSVSALQCFQIDARDVLTAARDMITAAFCQLTILTHPGMCGSECMVCAMLGDRYAYIVMVEFDCITDFAGFSHFIVGLHT